MMEFVCMEISRLKDFSIQISLDVVKQVLFWYFQLGHDLENFLRRLLPPFNDSENIEPL